MQRFSFKIAISIILAGFFIIACFAGLNYENLNQTFYIVSGLMALFVILFGFTMGFTYASPVKQLLKKADNIIKGDFKSKLNLNTRDEIEVLSKNFNKISDDILQKSTDMEDLKKSSEIKFKTKDIVSEKIIDALEEKIRNRTADLERSLKEIEMLKEQVAKKDREIQALATKPTRKKRVGKIL
ncbi:MAG: HAMP domain-containing protein [Candidatus Staskawiczbacteria bacterium]|nr:HAMP domain-containing protein [Candidatus Staskawiczbacteria bacterium]